MIDKKEQDGNKKKETKANGKKVAHVKLGGNLYYGFFVSNNLSRVGVEDHCL